MRLERRPEKTCLKTHWEKKHEICVGTIAHAPAIGSLSHGGFTELRLWICNKIHEKLNMKKLYGALNRVDSEA